MTKKVFVTGATGYIGGSVAEGFLGAGYEVSGLARSKEKAESLGHLGIKPVFGTLSDADVLKQACDEADIIVNAASSDNREAVDTMIPALIGTGKIFIQNSGSTVVSKRGDGSKSEEIIDDDTDFKPVPEKVARVELDKFVTDASGRGVSSYVLCPCLIYGEGLGLAKESAQVPAMVRQAIESGVSRFVGDGANIWSTIHIKDLVNLYVHIAKTVPVPGEFLFVENGEVEFIEIAETIQKALGLKGPAQSWTVEEASKYWGEGMTQFALASNSRVRAQKARYMGWKPEFDCVLDDVKRTCENLAGKETSLKS